jgi:hypothetical protein
MPDASVLIATVLRANVLHGTVVRATCYHGTLLIATLLRATVLRALVTSKVSVLQSWYSASALVASSINSLVMIPILS